MQIIVTKQIGIEAETIEAGIAKVANGEGQTISIGASARPQAGQISGGVTPAGRVLTGGQQNTQTIPTPAVQGK